MNWKIYERKRSFPSFKARFRHFPGGTGEKHRQLKLGLSVLLPIFERGTSQIKFRSVTARSNLLIFFLSYFFVSSIYLPIREIMESDAYTYLRMAALRAADREGSTLWFIMQCYSSLTVNNQRCWQNRVWRENTVMWFVTQQLGCKFVLRDFTRNCSSESLFHRAIVLLL
jgi:hypothetical protein